jgi:hypothetical protein
VATFCCPPQKAALQPWVRPDEVLIATDNTLTVVCLRRQHLLRVEMAALGMLGHCATTLFWTFPSETQNTLHIRVFWQVTPCRELSQKMLSCLPTPLW